MIFQFRVSIILYNLHDFSLILIKMVRFPIFRVSVFYQCHATLNITLTMKQQRCLLHTISRGFRHLHEG